MMPLLEQPGTAFPAEVKSIPGGIDFDLPQELEASEPPEARGLSRDQVRLMVSHYKSDTIIHTQFSNLPEFLEPGDVLVINTSGTIKAAVDAWRADGTHLKLHLSTHLPADIWVVELRKPVERGTKPLFGARTGEELCLSGGGIATLLTPHNPSLRLQNGLGLEKVRLWLATLKLPLALQEYLDRFGSAIRYPYVRGEWPISHYQTVYATESGSAEMPSAGRGFTPELVTQLVAQGVQFAPLILHTGVSSLEALEAPYEEYYHMPAESAHKINNAKARRKRILAVGTTSVRAIETVVDESGNVHPGEGWTNLVITAHRGLRVVDSLITGFHEPAASHFAILQALAGQGHLRRAYAEAVAKKYLWHEFGDLHLMLP